MTKRQQFSALTYGAFFMIALIILRGRVPALAEWEERTLPQGLPFDGGFWIPMGLGGVMLLLSRIIWRCPHCGAFPGPAAAVRCRACGKVLDEGAVLMEAPNHVVPELLPAHVEQFQRVLGRLRRFERRFHWTRLIVLSLAIAAGAGLVARILANGDKDAWGWAAMAAMVCGILGFIVVFQVKAIAWNALLTSLRCPGCDKSLINHLSEFCPFCGVRIPAAELASR